MRQMPDNHECPRRPGSAEDHGDTRGRIKGKDVALPNTETMKHGEKKEYSQPAPKTQLGG
jgi:hypothetical protein